MHSIRVTKEELPTIRAVNIASSFKFKYETTSDELNSFTAEDLGKWLD